MKALGRWAGRIGLIALGVVIYAVCINVFGGYPKFHTEALTWVAVAALAVFGGVVWIIDERRSTRDGETPAGVPGREEALTGAPARDATRRQDETRPRGRHSGRDGG